jgi:two-component SAPR family response regulator
MKPLKIRRKLRGPAGQRVEYTWEQRETDPATNIVLDTLSFVVTASGKAKQYPDAFVYHWRIWSIPEVRDAMMDAGFRAVDVYARMGDAIDSDGNLYVSPIQSGDELDENYVVYVVGRR